MISEMTEKCSNQHVEIHWNWEDTLMACPICSLRQEAITDEEHNRELDAKEEDISSLEYDLEERDKDIESLEDTIKEHKDTINALNVRIRQSVLGEIDRLGEKINTLKKVNEENIKIKERIIEQKNDIIDARERDLNMLERRVVPSHIPHEQYERYLREKNA